MSKNERGIVLQQGQEVGRLHSCRAEKFDLAVLHELLEQSQDMFRERWASACC